MEKVLLVGEFNDALNSTYQLLQGDYQVQLCKIEISEVANMVKITDPDLVLINAKNTEDFDTKILEHLQQMVNRIPVLFVGTEKECVEYEAAFDDVFFHFIQESLTQSELIQKCKDVLGNSKYINADNYDPNKGRKKKVLIVDDSGVFLRAVKAILEPQYEVLIAKTGKKALSIAEMELPDLVLLDYEMPGWNGRETLEKFRQRRKIANIPIVFLTAVSDKAHIIEVLKMQPRGYLLKPINSEELKLKIGEIIGS